MLTKRVCIELLQDRLTGGSATMDVRGKFDYRAIEAAMAIVFSDIVSSDRSLAHQMAIPYVQTFQDNKTLLSVVPVLGTRGIISVEQNGVTFPVMNGAQEAYLMSVLNMGLKSYIKTLVGRYLFSQGIEGEVLITLIPTIQDLDEDDNIIVEDMFEMLYAKMAQIMLPMQPKDVLENSASDADLKQ